MIKLSYGINTADGPTSSSGIIYADTNVERIKIIVTPLNQIKKGEIIKVRIKASTQEPYKKDISCEISLRVQELTENEYAIEDEVNRNYAILKLVNAESTGAQITLTFDPKDLRLDLNDEIYVNKVSEETSVIDGKNYVKKVVFNLDGETAKNIKFYKVDATQDFTYPKGSNKSAITVTM